MPDSERIVEYYTNIDEQEQDAESALIKTVNYFAKMAKIAERQRSIDAIDNMPLRNLSTEYLLGIGDATNAIKNRPVRQ